MLKLQFAPIAESEGMLAYDTASYLVFLMLPTQA